MSTSAEAAKFINYRVFKVLKRNREAKVLFLWLFIITEIQLKNKLNIKWELKAVLKQS